MKRVRYKNMVPPDSFIGRYMAHMAAVETAEAYDFFSACWLLSVALGRNTKVARPRAPVYLNTYIMFVAESGKTRKSAAVNEARDILALFQRRVDDPALFVESAITAENLKLAMAAHYSTGGTGQVAISISELVTVLGRQRFASDLPALLTDYYDCPTERRTTATIERGPATIGDIHISFLSASTPSWLLRAVNPDVIEGGFTSRCWFIHAEKPKTKIVWPEDDGGLHDDVRSLLADTLVCLRRDGRATPNIEINPLALRRLKGWYDRRETSQDPFRASFESREDAHILRLAALLAVNAGTWDIQVKDIERAIGIVGGIKADGAAIFTALTGRGDRGTTVHGITKVRDALIIAGMETRSSTELAKAGRPQLTSKDTADLLDIMHELGMVQRFAHVNKGKRGRPRTLWRGTKLLLAPDGLETVLNEMK